MSQGFPRLHARTRRFTIGAPRDFTISESGDYVLFLRAKNGTDPRHSLWRFDVVSGTEQLLVDVETLGTTAEVPAHILRMQERQRNMATGIVGYVADQAARTVVFSMAGVLWRTRVDSGETTALEGTVGAVNPVLSPDGTALSYVRDGALRVIDVDGRHRTLAEPEGPGVEYGLPDFNAAEDMERGTGTWWSPDGRRLLVARVDESRVALRHVAGGDDPAEEPVAQRYPLAGGANPETSMSVRGLDGSVVPVHWDLAVDDYLVSAHWSRHGILLTVLNRAQTLARVLRVDPDSGETTALLSENDDAFVKPIPGAGVYTASGRLVWGGRSGDSYRLRVDDEVVELPADAQLRDITGTDGDTVLFRATGVSETHLWTWSAEKGPRRLTTLPGVYNGRLRDGTLVCEAKTLEDEERVTVRRDDTETEIVSHVEYPDFEPRVSFLTPRPQPDLRVAVVLPRDYVRGSHRLPVLLDPYGGPGAQRTLAARRAYWTSQWFADQGFAVVIVDGRGTPGLGAGWDRIIHRDKVNITVADQVAGLHQAAERYPELDLDRVGIRGWSYGGTLSVAALLRRPDVFHAGSAGASSLDPRLYSSYYTERYLSHPDDHPGVYDTESLIGDAAELRGRLLLIHGLADDNVHPANTLRMSRALLTAGKQHEVLLLPDVTHMPVETSTLENLLWHELRFLRQALGMD